MEVVSKKYRRVLDRWAARRAAIYEQRKAGVSRAAVAARFRVAKGRVDHIVKLEEWRRQNEDTKNRKPRHRR